MSENFFKMPQASEKEKREVNQFIENFLSKLERNAYESQGFLNIPPENITIDSIRRIIEIKEPDEKMGVEKFSVRDEFEKTYPAEIIGPWAELENEIYDGKINPPSFHPEFGGRVCFHSINLYETAKGIFVSMPILPDSGQKYSGKAKGPGSNIIRGPRFPTIKEVTSAASSKESSNLEKIQKENPAEKIISGSIAMPTGLWTIRLTDKKGRFSDVRDCHIQRDIETGTLEIFKVKKKLVFDEPELLHPEENLPMGLKRANSFVALEKLKKTEEEKPIGLERLSFDNKPINNLEELPENYKNLFEKKEGKFFLKQFKPVPSFRAFLNLEKRIVDQNSPEAVKKIKESLGNIFEKMVSELFQRPKNEQELSAKIPEKKELVQLINGQPLEFQKWAINLKRKEITIKPDFILDSGTFLETKLAPYEAMSNPDQLFRMVLYSLLKGEKPQDKIKYLTYKERTCSDRIFSFIKYENIYDKHKKEIESRQLDEKINYFASLI